MTTLLTEQQAAALLKVSVKSLQGWRSRGGGPCYHKLGRCVRYSVADLEAFLQAAVRQSTSDPGSHTASPRIRTDHLLGKTGRRLKTPSATRPDTPSSPAPIPTLRFRARLRGAYITRTRRPPRE